MPSTIGPASAAASLEIHPTRRLSIAPARALDERPPFTLELCRRAVVVGARGRRQAVCARAAPLGGPIQKIADPFAEPREIVRRADVARFPVRHELAKRTAIEGDDRQSLAAGLQ